MQVYTTTPHDRARSDRRRSALVHRPLRLTLHQQHVRVAHARLGDAEAFGELYDAFGDPIYRDILRVLPDAARAEECLERTFHEAWVRLEEYDPSHVSVFHWLRLIGINVAYETLLVAGDIRLIPPLGELRLRPLDRHHLRDRTMKALAKLPEAYAHVIRMCVLRGLPREQVAQALRLEPDAVDELLYRACRELLGAYAP